MAILDEEGPFGASKLPDYGFGNAPLSRALTQIRFPRLSDLVSDQGAAYRVAKSLVREYPIFDESSEVSLSVTPTGVVPMQGPSPVWKFITADRTSTVTLSPSYVSFDTTQYVSRDDFVARFSRVLHTVNAEANLPVVERVGMRYTNQIVTPNLLSDVARWFRPELRVWDALPGTSHRTFQLMTDGRFETGDQEGLIARWGALGAGVTFDPSLPVPDGPWFALDLDAYSEKSRPAPTPEDLLDLVSSLAERSYRFFLWALSAEALIEFGGEQR